MKIDENQHNTEKDEQMAQLNITLNQEEILQLLSKDHDQAFRELLKSSLNSILPPPSLKQSHMNVQRSVQTAATAHGSVNLRPGSGGSH